MIVANLNESLGHLYGHVVIFPIGDGDPTSINLMTWTND